MSANGVRKARKPGKSVPYAERSKAGKDGQPRVRLPKPLATEARAAVDEGWPDEAAALLEAERQRRNVVHGKGKGSKP
jgi:hypothetical protein